MESRAVLGDSISYICVRCGYKTNRTSAGGSQDLDEKKAHAEWHGLCGTDRTTW